MLDAIRIGNKTITLNLIILCLSLHHLAICRS